MNEDGDEEEDTEGDTLADGAHDDGVVGQNTPTHSNIHTSLGADGQQIPFSCAGGGSKRLHTRETTVTRCSDIDPLLLQLCIIRERAHPSIPGAHKHTLCFTSHIHILNAHMHAFIDNALVQFESNHFSYFAFDGATGTLRWKHEAGDFENTPEVMFVCLCV